MDDASNLALACIDCNLRKGSNLTGIDPQSGKLIRIFDPRKQRWSDHFAWSGARLTGLTEVGRTTIRVLEMNSEDRVQLRLALQS